jgi:hypothetical protein
MVKSDTELLRKIAPAAVLVIAIVVGYKILQYIPGWFIAIGLVVLLGISLRPWFSK